MNRYLGFNGGTPTSLAQTDRPAGTTLLVDEQTTLNDGNCRPCGDTMPRTHTGGATFAYLDGHAKWQRPEKLMEQDYWLRPYPNRLSEKRPNKLPEKRPTCCSAASFLKEGYGTSHTSRRHDQGREEQRAQQAMPLRQQS